MSDFQHKLVKLIISETKGKTIETGIKEGKTAEIVESLACQLGKFIALSCGGDQETMSKFLDGASQYMYEVAADTQKAGKFLGEFDKRLK